MRLFSLGISLLLGVLFVGAAVIALFDATMEVNPLVAGAFGAALLGFAAFQWRMRRKERGL